jgi:hypothetical protein
VEGLDVFIRVSTTARLVTQPTSGKRSCKEPSGEVIKKETGEGSDGRGKFTVSNGCTVSVKIEGVRYSVKEEWVG